MINLLCGLLLTTFVVIDGNVTEVPVGSPEHIAYEQESVTDIGNPDNFVSTLSIDNADTVSSGDSETVSDSDSQIVSLLSEQVELLAENSSSVTGSINTSVLDLMDRMIDEYPSYYKYAGFRVDSSDSYRTTLYIAKRATSNGGLLTFSEDCIAVNFYRYQQSGYSSYIYYEISDSPNATVDVNSDSIAYTNVLDGYPSLGNKSQIPEEYIWIGILAIVVIVIFTRRNGND